MNFPFCICVWTEFVHCICIGTEFVHLTAVVFRHAKVICFFVFICLSCDGVCSSRGQGPCAVVRTLISSDDRSIYILYFACRVTGRTPGVCRRACYPAEYLSPPDIYKAV